MARKSSMNKTRTPKGIGAKQHNNKTSAKSVPLHKGKFASGGRRKGARSR